MKRNLIRLAVSTALLAALTASARADVISGSVQFDPGLSTPTVYANGVSSAPGAFVPGLNFQNWTGWNFSDVTLPSHGVISGETITGDIGAFGLQAGQPARFGNNGNGTPFTLTFDVKEGTVPAAITFSGVLYGSLTKDAHGNETSTLSIDWLGPTSKDIDINHHIYELSVSDVLRGGTFPDGDKVGRFDVEIKVMHNPEPASLVLAALGLPALGLTWVRRKRRARKSAAC